MTVTVRPVPKRAHQNGIRPFRLVVPANNIRPYTLKTWKPPVPEPLRPAPLLGPKELLGLGLLVLAQLWGGQNSPRQDAAAEEPGALGYWKPIGGGSGELVLQWKLEGSTQIQGGRWPGSVVKVEHSSTFIPESAGHPKGSGSTYDLKGYDNTGTLVTSGSLAVGGFAGTVLQGCSKPPCDVLEYVNVLYDRQDGSQLEPLPYKPFVPGPAPQPFTFPPAEPARVPEPQPEPLPLIPPQPAPSPTTVPQPVPMEPGPSKPPIVTPIPRPPAVPQVPAIPGAVEVPNGTVAPARPLPVPVTPPDAHFPVPGAPPVTGNGPRPTPEGIAQELGRLEQKLARLSNPGPGGPGDGTDRLALLADVLGRIYEFLTSITDSGTYTLSSPCELDENGNRVVVPVDYSGAAGSLGVLSNKIDALAQVLQVHKDLKQPNCSTKPVLTGEWVTVNFQSDEASAGGERPLRKVLRYRDQTAAPLEDHLAHWESFAWDAGPVIVVSKNLSWGTPKVWAASAAEGKRVISHAAQMAGVDLTDPKHEWIVTGSNDPRYGRTGRMRLDTRGGKFMRVTSRPGPSGLPSGFAPDS